ncbi:MAG: PilZ domain-containing protein [Deltaproteobacteria bacterium]|nr:PilZ domain-containing protein [Deltaproteobacteria bacterium]
MNRRKHQRAPVEIWVKEENGDFFFTHRASNISVGGFFLEKKVFRIKSSATFFFRLPTSDELIVVRGRSVYDTALDPDKTSIGTGIQFTDLSLDAKKLIHEYVTTFSRSKRSTS